MSTFLAKTLERESREGRFVRQQFRDRVTADGSSGYKAEPGRYHLYVCLACPWAHRTLIMRRLKKLEDVIGLSLVDPIRDENGWRFDVEDERFADPLNGWTYLSEAYDATDPDFEGRYSVPVLWDKQTGRIVNNESADIIEMLNDEFDEWGDASVDLWPDELREEMSELNDRVYANVNNGVYRAGFARSQEAYEEAFEDLFATLNELEERLAKRRYLVGDRLTLADLRLWTTLVRFDAVYYTHFKTNLRRIVDYPNLWAFARDLYARPEFGPTVDMDQIKRHYFMTHETINPSGIVPLGPVIDFDEPHDRERLETARR